MMLNTKKVLLTGATGFVGKSLSGRLLEDEKISLRVSTRLTPNIIANPRLTVFSSIDISEDTNWLELLEGCDVVIHTAARVHIMKEAAENPLEEFRRINVDGTLNLARQAAEQNVKRFIFISSIKVNGESTSISKPFTISDEPRPEDHYAMSKYEAELGLRKLSASTGMEVVIIRPPLIYGSGVKGNFNRMVSWVNKGLPLPLGKISNKRSFVSIDNLISLIVLCMNHPQAANQIFLVSDGQDVSTTELLRRVGEAIHKPARLLPISPWILNIIATVLRKKDDYNRLCGSLRIDISKTCEILNWQPPITLTEALGNMIDVID